MSKKVISILLSAAMLVAMMCVGFGAVTASAAGETYYFLAPDDWFDTTKGAQNSDIGVWCFGGTDPMPEGTEWPGVKAEQVEGNLFKYTATGSPVNIIFNAYVDAGTPVDPEKAKFARQTQDINLEGYENDCPYDKSVNTDDFNGWVFVVNNNDKAINDFSKAETTNGAWFSMNESDSNYYKNNDTYYGSYGFDAAESDTAESDTAATDTAATDTAATDTVATDTAATDTAATDTAAAETKDDATKDDPNAPKKYHKDDIVTVDVKIAGVTMRDGSEAKLAGYNYELTYDTNVLALTKTADGKVATMVNGTPNFQMNDVGGKVVFADAAASGFDMTTGNIKDGATIVTVKFTVTADTNDLGIEGLCKTLSVASADGSKTEKLVGKPGTAEKKLGLTEDDLKDTYTKADVTVECPHTGTDTTSDKGTDTSDKGTDTSDKGTDTSAKGSDKETKSDSDKKETNGNASSDKKSNSSSNNSNGSSTATVQTAGTFAVVSLVVILMAAAAVVLYTRKKTEE